MQILKKKIKNHFNRIFLMFLWNDNVKTVSVHHNELQRNNQ